MQNPANLSALPWTKEQFAQIKTLLTVTIPAQEDNLKRAAASGLDVAKLQNDLAAQKSQLQKMFDAWKDKY